MFCIYCDNISGYQYMICFNCENKEEIKSDKNLGYRDGYKHGLNKAKQDLLMRKLQLFVSVPNVPYNVKKNKIINDIFWYNIMYKEGYEDAYNHIKLLYNRKNVVQTELLDTYNFRETMIIFFKQTQIHKKTLFDPNIITMIKKMTIPLEY